MGRGVNGRDLALASLATLAVAGVAARRGSSSRATTPAQRAHYDALAASYAADGWRHGITAWAADHDLVRLGSGESRAVFAERDPARVGLPPLHVLKLNHGGAGHDGTRSSREEIRVWTQAPAWLRPYLVPILDYDPDGRWILMEYAEPLYSSSYENADEDGADASEVIPVEIIRKLRACGVSDLVVQNVSADGRLLDYGWVKEDLWTPCVARGEAGPDLGALKKPRPSPQAVAAAKKAVQVALAKRRAGAGRAGSRNAPERTLAKPVLIPYADFEGMIQDGAASTPVLWDANVGPKDALTLGEICSIYSDLVYDDAGSYARQFYKELNTAAQVFADVSFPLTLYRGVDLAPGQELYDRHGHWSLSREVALHFARGTHEASEPTSNGRPVLLEGVVRSPKDVRWAVTFGAWLRYSQTPDPSEAEEQVYATVKNVQPIDIRSLEAVRRVRA